MNLSSVLADYFVAFIFTANTNQIAVFLMMLKIPCRETVDIKWIKYIFKMHSEKSLKSLK